MNTIAQKVEETLKEVVPKMVNETTNQNMKDNLPMVVIEGIGLEREKTKADIASMVADVVRKEQECTRVKLSLQVSNDVATNVPPVDAFCRQDHEDHRDDDALPKGESSAKRQRTSEKRTYIRGEKHEYHLDQMKTYMKSRIVWESRQEDLTLQIPKKPDPLFQSCEKDPNAPPRFLVKKDLFYLKNVNSKTRKYVLSLYKIHAFPFLENDLEELNTIWLKKRADPDEVYSYQRIVDVIRVQYDQGHGQEFMKEIVVKRVDGEYSSFSKSDYKYLHKNDIEDMYLMKEFMIPAWIRKLSTEG
ncbi:hypothetical protein Tco_1268636 [Tanacetum coccineum]